MDICIHGKITEEEPRVRIPVTLIFDPNGTRTRIGGIYPENMVQAVRDYYLMREHQLNTQTCDGSGKHPEDIGGGGPGAWGLLVAYCPVAVCKFFEVVAQIDNDIIREFDSKYRKT